MAGLQRLRQGVIIDHRTARSVYEISAFAHCGELLAPDEAPRLFGHAGVQRHDIALAEQLVECKMPNLIPRVGRRELHIRVGHKDAAAERLQQTNDFRADMTIADHADRHL